MYWQGALVFLVVISSIHCRDQNFDDGIVSVRVKGRSGKIEICQKANNATKRRGKCSTLEFDDITETSDEAGASVSCPKHFYRSMAQTDFAVSDQEDRTFQNLSITYFNFSAPLQGNRSQFTAQVYIFRENGSYTIGSEEVNVLAGDVKINVELDGWVFCGDGPGEEKPTGQEKAGIQVTITMAIKGPSGGKPKKKAPGPRTDGRKPGGKLRKYRKPNNNTEDFDLGDDTSLSCSKYVEVRDGNNSQGSMKQMAAGYPKLDTQGSKNFIVVAFPKGQTMVYDPTMQIVDIDPEAVYDDDDDGGNGNNGDGGNGNNGNGGTNDGGSGTNGSPSVASSICILMTCWFLGLSYL